MKTVSNVVNDYPHIRPETRARVLKAIDELGYRPSISARNLSRGRTGLIALALPVIDAPYFGEMARLIIKAAEAHSWTVLIEQTDGLRARELMAIQDARSHLVDGVILSPLALGPRDLMDSLGEAPIVLLGERVSDVPLDHVAIDNVAAAREAVTHLVSTGRRRIAAIGAQNRESAQTAHLRLAGYKEALDAAGLPYQPQLVRGADEWRRTEGVTAMRELLKLDERPDAVFCFNDLLALGAMRALHEAGLSIPADVAIAGFDDIEDGRFSAPSLTTVAPDKEQTAKLSVELLARRLRRYPPPPPPEEITAGHTMVIRESSTMPAQ